jgi:hypothetical protein
MSAAIQPNGGDPPAAASPQVHNASRGQPLPAAALWAAAILTVLIWGVVRLGQADLAWREARDRHATTVRDLARLEALRAQVPSPASGRRPQDDLVVRAQQALAAAGLPASACSGVQPRADQTAGGVRIQSVQLRLTGLRPADIGAWLAAWAAGGQTWNIGELQMNHAAGGTDGAAALDIDRYDLTLVLTTPYVEDHP